MNRILLIDARNLFFLLRFHHYKSDSELPEDPGFLLSYYVDRIWELMQDTQCSDFAICMDSPPYLRAKEYPVYKISRQEDTPKGVRTWKAVKSSLINSQAKVFRKDGYEGEDLIANFCRIYGNHPDYSLVICSSDKDLFQLLGLWSNVTMWNIYKCQWQPQPVYDWVDYLSLMGDSSDAVTGVTGETTADLLMQGKKARGSATLDELLDKPYKPKKIDQEPYPKTNREVFERNRRLIRLVGCEKSCPDVDEFTLPANPQNTTLALSTILGRAWRPPMARTLESIGATV